MLCIVHDASPTDPRMTRLRALVPALAGVEEKAVSKSKASVHGVSFFYPARNKGLEISNIGGSTSWKLKPSAAGCSTIYEWLVRHTPLVPSQMFTGTREKLLVARAPPQLQQPVVAPAAAPAPMPIAPPQPQPPLVLPPAAPLLAEAGPLVHPNSHPGFPAAASIQQHASLNLAPASTNEILSNRIDALARELSSLSQTPESAPAPGHLTQAQHGTLSATAVSTLGKAFLSLEHCAVETASVTVNPVIETIDILPDPSYNCVKPKAIRSQLYHWPGTHMHKPDMERLASSLTNRLGTLNQLLRVYAAAPRAPLPTVEQCVTLLRDCITFVESMSFTPPYKDIIGVVDEIVASAIRNAVAGISQDISCNSALVGSKLYALAQRGLTSSDHLAPEPIQKRQRTRKADGPSICRNFNTGKGDPACRDGLPTCPRGRTHKCSKCGDSHPAHTCK